nr:hypothetical protein [Micromonospora sp. DSM 115978]
MTAALMLLSATAACGSSDPDPAGSAGPSATAASPTAPAVDLAAATSQACAEAIPLSEKSAADFMTDMEKALEVAVTGSEADAEKALQELRGNLTAWATKLTELAEQPIEEPVKAALTASATTIQELAKPEDNTPVSQVEKALQEAAAGIKTACA